MGVFTILSKKREEIFFDFQLCLSLFKGAFMKQGNLPNTLQSIITFCESTLSHLSKTEMVNENFIEDSNNSENENENFLMEHMEDYEDYNDIVDLDDESSDDD